MSPSSSSFFLFCFVLLTTCFILCSSLSITSSSSSLPPSPLPPILSNTFLDPNVVIYDAAEIFFKFHCYIAQYEDPSNSSDLYSYLDSFGQFYGHLANETQLTLPQLNSSAAYLTLNGICRVEPSANLIPSFSLLSLTFQGFQNLTQTFQNNRTVECQVWHTPNNTLTFYILPSSSSSSPDIIVRISINPSNSSGLGFAYLLDFSPNFQPNPSSLSPSSPVFQIPSQCTSNHLCPQGPVIPLEVYNFHEVNYFWLNNTNAADLIGDTTFFCSAVIYGGFNYFEWISQWQMEVNSTWGQYTLCNFGSCVGGDNQLVGREAADGLNLEYGGQCVPNPMGSWYSFPVSTECSQEQNVGDEGCTWKVLARSKTINASCLSTNRDFLEACSIEFPTGNLTKTSQIFGNAFLSDDPNQGGCPPIAVNAQNPNGGEEEQKKEKEKQRKEKGKLLSSSPLRGFLRTAALQLELAMNS